MLHIKLYNYSKECSQLIVKSHSANHNYITRKDLSIFSFLADDNSKIIQFKRSSMASTKLVFSC